MQASATYWREYTAHCEAMMDVLGPAEAVCFLTDAAGQPVDTGICMLPALRAFKVSHTGWRRFRTYLEDEEYVTPHSYCHNARGEAFLILPLPRLFPLLHFSRHPVALRFSVWQCRVQAVLAEHGYYDPPTNHQVPVGLELDAAELKAGLYEITRASFGPHIAAWLAGQDEAPETPEAPDAT